MPKGFAYPLNHDAWAPLSLRTSYAPLEGDAISVIGRLAAGVSLEQANAEVRVFAERAAAAFPATHANLQAIRTSASDRVTETPDVADLASLPQNLPVLLDPAHRMHERRHARFTREPRLAKAKSPCVPRSARAARGSSVSSSWRLSCWRRSRAVVGLIAAEQARWHGESKAVNRSSGGARSG